MSKSGRSRSWWIIPAAIVLLAVLHQDFWFWDDRTLVFGFLPMGLAYHALYSIAAAALWFAAIRLAWPVHIEQWADDVQESS